MKEITFAEPQKYGLPTVPGWYWNNSSRIPFPEYLTQELIDVITHNGEGHYYGPIYPPKPFFEDIAKRFTWYTASDIKKWKPHPRLKTFSIKRKGKVFLENTFDDENAWHINQTSDDIGSYYFEIRNRETLLEAIAHITEKEWVDKARFFDALLPIIRGFREEKWKK